MMTSAMRIDTDSRHPRWNPAHMPQIDPTIAETTTAAAATPRVVPAAVMMRASRLRPSESLPSAYSQPSWKLNGGMLRAPRSCRWAISPNSGGPTIAVSTMNARMMAADAATLSFHSSCQRLARPDDRAPRAF